MRKGRDGEQKTKTENNDGNSGPLSSLPVDPLNGDRLQRRRSFQNKHLMYIQEIIQEGGGGLLKLNK